MKVAVQAHSRQPRSRSRWGAAVLGGLLQFAAFPPLSLGALAFVALVPIYWAAFQRAASGEPPPGFRRRFLLGFSSQFVFYIALLHWILLLSNEEITVPGLMVPALLFMAAYLSVFFGTAIALAGLLADRRGISPLVSLPVLWTLLDRLRSLGELAFPWGSIGYALAPLPSSLQLTSWTGYWALPFWIVAVNGLVYGGLRAAATGSLRGAVWRLGAALAAWSGPILFGGWLLSRAPNPPDAVDAWPEMVPTFQLEAVTGGSSTAGGSEMAGAGRVASGPRPMLPEPVGTEADLADLLPAVPDSAGLRLALIQANTPREIKWKEDYRDLVIDDLLARTRQAARLDPDLIVWPETAAPVMVLWWPALASRVRETVAELHRWVLIGTLDAVMTPEREDHFNAAILMRPDGFPAARYFKTRLVPFSETMPFKEEAPWLGALNFGQSDFTPGPGQVVFRPDGHPFSVLICFESIFPEISRDAVLRGARYLVNTTNDFWFGPSAGPVQHAQMAIHRAVENRTPLARCANTGISFFVDPYGRVYGQTGLFVEAMPATTLPPGTGGSFYTRHGDWFSVSLLMVAGLSALALPRRRGSRRKS